MTRQRFGVRQPSAAFTLDNPAIEIGIVAGGAKAPECAARKRTFQSVVLVSRPLPLSRRRIQRSNPLCRLRIGLLVEEATAAEDCRSPKASPRSVRGSTRQRFGVRETRTTDRDLRLRAAPPAAFTTENPAIESSFRQRIGLLAVQRKAAEDYRSPKASPGSSPLPLFETGATRALRLPSRTMPEPRTPWPHAPTHQLSQRATYFVTASTYLKAHHFRGAGRLRVLHRGLLTVARDFGWQFEAWAVFSNHYHFIAHSPADADDATSLPAMLRMLHVKTAEWVNKLDRSPRRKVWFNYRETRLTYQRSYLARLNYVHQNPVKHRLVVVANQYPWCSAGWFERTASAAQVKTVCQFKIDKVRVFDDFEPSPDW
jgi:putative transposase